MAVVAGRSTESLAGFQTMRILSLVLCSIASSVAAAQVMFPTPSNAIKPTHDVIVPGVSEQDHFWLSETYPKSSAVEHYRKIFAGWRPCYGRERNWSSFVDRSGEGPRYIHQLLRHWASPANDVAVTLGLRYTSSGLGQRVNPDTDEQSVVLVRIKHSDAVKFLEEMDVKCEKAS